MQKLTTGRWLGLCFLFFAVTLPLFLGGCGGKPDATFNITGSWYFYPASPGVLDPQNPAGPGLYAFTQSTNNLTGSTPVKNGSLAITGSVSDVDVSFQWTGTDQQTVYIYTGTVFVDGTMSGNWSSSNAQTGAKQAGLWNAIVSGAPFVDLNGTNWNVFAATAGGAGEQALGAFSFTQAINADTNVNNDLRGATPQGPIISGSNTSLTVLFFWQDAASTLYTYKGTISGGNTMTGTWTSDKGQSGTWRATKNG